MFVILKINIGRWINASVFHELVSTLHDLIGSSGNCVIVVVLCKKCHVFKEIDHTKKKKMGVGMSHSLRKEKNGKCTFLPEHFALIFC